MILRKKTVKVTNISTEVDELSKIFLTYALWQLNTNLNPADSFILKQMYLIKYIDLIGR